MGMYTELVLEGNLINITDIPSKDWEMIRYLFDSSLNVNDIDELNLPDHPLFKTSHWLGICSCSSFYNNYPGSISKLINPFADNINMNNMQKDEYWYIFTRFDIKNYENELDLFLDWITKYMYDYKGFICYEEDEDITSLSNYNFNGHTKCKL